MKPRFSHWTANLALLFSLLVFPHGLSAAVIQVGAIPERTGDSSPASPVTLQGNFHILWGDPRQADGPGEIFYLLIDDQGQVQYLDLSAAGVPFDRLLRLNAKQVSLQGFLPAELRHLPRASLQVEAIRLLEPGSSPAPDASQPLPSVLGSQPYVSILCKFSDLAIEPKNLAFFQGMYANTFPGLDHYWRELSYNQVDLLGSSAYGWFTLPQPRTYYVYDMNSDGDPDADFNRLVTDCTSVADASLNFPSFKGINLMFNADLDESSYGGSWTLGLDGSTQSYGMTWIANWGYDDISVVEHEMGHTFGLPHSSGMYGATYDNFWDVMSWDRQWGLFDSSYGRTGQHTIAYHKHLLGWFASADRVTVPQDGAVHTYTIERLANPLNSANLKLAILPVIGSTRFYTLETRQWLDGGYDKNINGFQVIIHEVDPARPNQAQVVDYDNDFDTNGDGARWQTWPGLMETFFDATDGISVTVSAVGETFHTVRVKITIPAPFTTCPSQSQMPQASCEALQSLYTATNGAGWTNHLDWGGPEWPCRWYGVRCQDEFGQVKQLQFRANNLVGSLPSQLENLLQLSTAIFESNQLSGPIPPSFGNLVNLNQLNLRENQFSGSLPAELGSMTALNTLDVQSNQLSGSLPSSLGNLANLQGLYLSHNQFSGGLPASLGNLSNLLSLDVSHNQLGGSLPPELGSLTNLTSFYLDVNQFTGSIPAYIGNFTNLFGLRLNNNLFSGALPPELGNLSNLWEIIANDNQLSGEIPAALGGLANLRYAYLYHNQLSGTIPDSLVSLPNLDGLRLNDNALSGPIPAALGANPSLSYLYLANNLLSGEIPANLAGLPELYQLDLGYNALSASDPTLLTFLNVKDPDWAQTQTMAPTGLQAVTQGADVQLSWIPILYTGGAGGYEISAAPALGGPYIVLGNTIDKSAASFTAAGFGPGSYYFRLRTLSQKPYQQASLWSLYTAPFAYQVVAVYIPLTIR